MSDKKYYIYLFISFVIGISISFFLSELVPYNVQFDKKSNITSTSTPEKIVCISPSIAEIVFELGMGDKVIGVSNYCTYPPDATKKTNIGEYLNPNLEKILSLKPDLVIYQGRHDKLADFCRSNSIPFFNIEFKNLDSIFENITKIGSLINKEHESQILNEKIRESFDNLSQKIINLEKPKVLISLWRKSGSLSKIFTCGKGSFMDELITKAGGHNVFSDIDNLYFEISLESISKRNPEIIIETLPGLNLSQSEKHQFISDWQEMSYLPASSSKRIYILTEDYLQIPGPRIFSAALCIAKVLHPEAFE